MDSFKRYAYEKAYVGKGLQGLGGIFSKEEIPPNSEVTQADYQQFKIDNMFGGSGNELKMCGIEPYTNSTLQQLLKTQ